MNAGGELWVTLCTYMGDGGKQALEPVMPLIAYRCRAWLAHEAQQNQQKRLPSQSQPKQIEGPDKATDDDEIPF